MPDSTNGSLKHICAWSWTHGGEGTKVRAWHFPLPWVDSSASIRTSQRSVPEAAQVRRHNRALQRGSAIRASAVGGYVAHASFTLGKQPIILTPAGFFEAKAILLGRLGRHDSALETYVYRLQDYLGAEEYCKRVYKPSTETSQIFLTLLRIYLRPSPSSPLPTPQLLGPALELISRHSPRLDAVETLDLLPPLVPARDLEAFLKEALRAPIFDTHVVREVAKSRKDDVSRKLMGLQMRRVKVTDSRMWVAHYLSFPGFEECADDWNRCPQCHKRIGSNSVIAVHAPR